MIKELDDYLDILENKYPHISRYELKRVLEHGFHTFYTLNKKELTFKYIIKITLLIVVRCL